ncbi:MULTISPECIES: RadC family protein [unclassified Sphingobacterium]|uniref:RadC family protein n=1 Tax=unclassified Sphingobacterium TaxID=2609468 RepID=UPI00104AE9FF|nr:MULTISPECIES: DNA repair protein RadC [unclassified Sphingobacterium]MCS3557136.1 DNA repair protein RadC [Sphingobacterium sp. JUb21]TCQ97369.1 DNA repair protein RadC [Sphingobacterium sp. JUb20]
MSKLVIRDWAEADRPREKLLEQGRRSLSDAELLAILIGSGSRQETAVELCRRILSSVQNNLHSLSKLEVMSLCEFKGIGEAKAITIVAALELGRRRKESEYIEKPLLNSSLRVYEYFRYQLQDLPHEEFWVLYLNTACKVLDKQLIGRGGNDFTPVDVRIILRNALNCKAHSMILIHNHPSGSREASQADKILTKKIAEASRIMDIKVNDHIIFTDNGYYSFRDEGLLE